MWKFNHTIKPEKQLKGPGAFFELPLAMDLVHMHPDPANPCSEKHDLHVLPQSVMNLHWLFNMSNVNTHVLTCFSKIKACVPWTSCIS